MIKITIGNDRTEMIIDLSAVSSTQQPDFLKILDRLRTTTLIW